MAKQYQYKHTPFLTELEMNLAGEQGWELVTVLYGDNGVSMANKGSPIVLFWKRELDGDRPPNTLAPFVQPRGRPFDSDLR